MDELSIATAIDIERRFDLEPGTLGAALTCMLAELPAGLCIQDTSGHYRFVNRQMAALFERPVSKLMNGHSRDWFDPAEVDELGVAERAASGQTGAQTRHHALRIGGHQRSFAVTRRRLPNPDKRAPVWLCSIWRELDGDQAGPDAAVPVSLAAAALAGGLEADADGDAAVSPRNAPPVTIGRTLFNDQLRREHDLSNREHREFALVSIAIDGEHQSVLHDELADRQLEQRVEGLLRGNIRAMDSSFRVAANLFFMILSGVGLATAHSRVEALRRQCVIESAALGDASRRLTLSIGVASFPHTSRDRDEIVAAAETALGVAQQRGGNQVALARITFESG